MGAHLHRWAPVNEQCGNGNRSFLAAHGQRSGVWYAFRLLDVVLDSSDDRERGSVRAARMFLPNFRAVSGSLVSAGAL